MILRGESKLKKDTEVILYWNKVCGYLDGINKVNLGKEF